MIFWIDAQLSPALAVWIADVFEIEAKPLRELGLRDASDVEIFEAARNANAVVVTKDSDFLELLDRFGPPPQILWVTCGNTSNAKIKEILLKATPETIQLLRAGERMVEISDSIK